MIKEYQKIRTKLLEQREELEKFKELQKEVNQEAKQKNSTEIEKLTVDLKKVQAKMAKVNAYITMAENKHCEHQEPKHGKEFNNATMAQLAVKLNSSEGKKYASLLYTEARSQNISLKAFATAYELGIRSRIEADEKEKLRVKVDYSGDIAHQKEILNAYLHAGEVEKFHDRVENFFHIFTGVDRGTQREKELAIGCIPLDWYTAGVGGDIFTHWARMAFSYGRDTAVPLTYDFTGGKVFLTEFEPINEAHVIGGLQNVLYNFLLHRKQPVKQILMVDPVRNNDTALGALSVLCGLPGSPVMSVPKEPMQIRYALGKLLETLKEEERHRKNSYEDREIADRLVVLHDFPVGYDNEQIRWIQELCVSAKHYGVVVFVTYNRTAEASKMVREAVNMISGYAECIHSDGNRFYVEGITQETTEFTWFGPPPSLTSKEIESCISHEEEKDLNNHYEYRMDISKAPRYLKGKRRLDYIPYGLDEDAVLQTLDFEEGNYGCYICGASRSGKSTLLHTIISSILVTTHPDDVEIWLVDFKKTEFSRYIDHLPPHVRYVVLDEAPELVYDVIDRLTEILYKRKNYFMGKWDKFTQVPTDIYMPEIFVIIDEFSKMSQVLKDTTFSSQGDYTIKLQNLLTEGAAFGFKFIFSSQDFSEGTRGLTNTAKKQIQQRIAMYNKAPSEIKETLGLTNASEIDLRMMENLEQHHTLMRISDEGNGVHLKLAKPLFFQEKETELDFIDKINQALHPVSKYRAEECEGYIYKKPLIVDGNSYTPYSEKEDELSQLILAKREEGESIIALGEPRRMLSVYTTTILDSYGENILMFAPVNESESAASVVMTMENTLSMQRKRTHLWAFRRSGVYKRLSEAGSFRGTQSSSLEAVCEGIRELREKIEQKIAGNDFYFLLGMDSYLADMAYLPEREEATTSTQTKSKPESKKWSLTFEARAEGELDLVSQLFNKENGLENTGTTEDNAAVPTEKVESSLNPGEEDSAQQVESREYDAREDFKYVLTQGPRFGYHFCLVCTALPELKQHRIRLEDFKHKILFRVPKEEATGVVSTANASVIQDLEGHAFRYTNGLEALSLRPYTHVGVFGDEAESMEEEEEYLM